MLSPCLLVLTAVVVAHSAPATPKQVTVEVRVDSEAPGYEGYRALDGNPQSMWHTEWQRNETKHPHYLLVDLGAEYEVKGIGYLPRPGGGNGTIKELECNLSNDAKDFGNAVLHEVLTEPVKESVLAFDTPRRGRYLKLVALSEVAGRPWTSVAELRILVDGVQFRAKPSPGAPVLGDGWEQLSELDRQWAMLQRDLRSASHFARVAAEAYRPEALIAESDRDPTDVVLRRTRALLEHLQTTGGPARLGDLGAKLRMLEARNEELDAGEKEQRRALFERACELRRQVAFANPLLDFDRLLFLKRHRATFNHMCDQYYGINAVPGGGLFVLEHPFGNAPQVRDVLADSVVERGRLKGQKLTGGSFLSPDLSFDGRQIAFAYVECQGDKGHVHHTDPTRGHWTETRCYHVFKVNVDGTGLEQLTDGTWNDFDPCWLPNGRVAFITERRGGYLRCGRVCPNYTLFDMAPTGAGIRCLSFHETNEWHPSVTAEGRIIYTRWDYIDRHGCTAHQPWITTLDGRDSRALHGNFALRRSRPDMELDVRAIPGSRKFVATAAPHHGQAFGSLVLIDPNIEDDDAMAPLKRLTPEVAFPESQGGAQVYGTAWPLSEDFYLCAYDPGMTPGIGRQGRGYVRGDYGLYLVDSFGNKELLYRDPKISCQNPMPLRPRLTPRVAPALADNAARTAQTYVPNPPAEATVVVMNVYDSQSGWPEGTRLAALRVFEVLPMTVPSGRPPHETGLRLPSARDSVNPVRWVLGTVPVEPDGSAHFTVPAEKELFFQALDQDGLAVQSMRSATYAQAGEKLVCQGCHERRTTTVPAGKALPLALRRSPSKLTPDVDGSKPFSYPRLVQPVLDKHCVPCHTQNAGKAPNLGREPVQRNWYASYLTLVPKYVFHNYGSPVRTQPGHFGARASKLYQMLTAGHHGLKLPPQDLHRLALWLDSTSMFYGVYEKESGQAQLAGKINWGHIFCSNY